MTVQVRRLTERGIKEMSSFHTQIYRGGTTDEVPQHLLHHDEFSEPFEMSDGKTPSIDPNRRFETQMDLAKYLCEVFDTEQSRSKLLDDSGAGAWLSLLYFDQLCIRKKNGRWSALEKARYVPDMWGWRYYRHHIFNSLLMYTTHGDDGRILLYTPPHRLSEFSRYLSEQSEVILNKEMVMVVDRLYWDEEGGAPKTGSVDPNLPVGDGTLRRFAGPNSFVFQHSPTWDFLEMEADTIWDMLPEEFDGWKHGTPTKKSKSFLARLGLRRE